jgi:hypothetical protein
MSASFAIALPVGLVGKALRVVHKPRGLAAAERIWAACEMACADRSFGSKWARQGPVDDGEVASRYWWTPCRSADRAALDHVPIVTNAPPGAVPPRHLLQLLGFLYLQTDDFRFERLLKRVIQTSYSIAAGRVPRPPELRKNTADNSRTTEAG